MNTASMRLEPSLLLVQLPVPLERTMRDSISIDAVAVTATCPDRLMQTVALGPEMAYP